MVYGSIVVPDFQIPFSGPRGLILGGSVWGFASHQSRYYFHASHQQGVI